MAQTSHSWTLGRPIQVVLSDTEKYYKACHGYQLMNWEKPPKPVHNTQLLQEPWEDITWLSWTPSFRTVGTCRQWLLVSVLWDRSNEQDHRAENTIKVLKTIFDRHDMHQMIQTAVLSSFQKHLKNTWGTLKASI